MAQIPCIICGKPGIIHWTPFYINADGELRPTDGGSFGQTSLCDTHFESFFANAQEWLVKARAGA